MEEIEVLNNIYESMCKKSKYIQKTLKENGYQSKKGFYNNHSVRDKNGNWNRISNSKRLYGGYNQNC